MNAKRSALSTLNSLSTELLNRETRREEQARVKKILAMREGKWLHTEFSATGKEPDPELMKATRAVVNGCYYTVASTTVYTPLKFWYVDDEMLETFKAKIAEMEESAKIYNAIAVKNGTERRLLVNYFVLDVNVEDEALALRLGQHVRSILGEMKSCLLNKDRKGFEMARDHARNMQMLAIGEQSKAIEAAIDELNENKTRVFGMMRRGNTQDIATLKWPLTERAMSMFQPID